MVGELPIQSQDQDPSKKPPEDHVINPVTAIAEHRERAEAERIIAEVMPYAA